MVTLVCSGVSAASSAPIGPACPSSFRVPPAGRFADILNGNAEAKENLFTSILTLSYTRAGSAEPLRPMLRLPSLMLSLSTDRFWLLPVDGSTGVAGFALLLPRLEKFHFSPSCER